VGCQGLTGCSGRQFGGIQKAGQNYGTSALHVIIKNWVSMTEGVQVVESMLSGEVLHKGYDEDSNQESNFSYLELD
jgi:hypothetical protein